MGKGESVAASMTGIYLRRSRQNGQASCVKRINDLVARAFGSAGLPVTKEPHGLHGLTRS